MPQPSKSRILSITREIHALEQQMEPLKRKQAQLHAELELALQGVDENSADTTGSGLSAILSVKQRVEDFVVQHAGKWSASQIHAKMPDIMERTISATLSRLATGAGARIERVGNGLYSKREAQSNAINSKASEDDQEL